MAPAPEIVINQMNLPSDLLSAKRLHAVGRNAEALATLEAHCKRHPRDGRGHYLLAVVRRALRDFEGAERTVRTLTSSPSAPVQHVAALIAIDRGDATEAVRRLRKALVCEPGHIGAWDSLAGIRLNCHDAVTIAAIAAILDPDDLAAWDRLRAVIATSGSALGSSRVRRLLVQAIDRTETASPDFARAARTLLPDWRRVTGDGSELAANEDAAVRWLTHLAAQFSDTDAVVAGLDKHLRALAAWYPGSRLPWHGLLVVHGRNADPVQRRLLNLVRRVAVFDQTFRDLSELGCPFRACVEAKSVVMESGSLVAGSVGHALGMQALANAADLPVSVRWGVGCRIVRLGDREVHYGLPVPETAKFVSRLFLFEPGLWRWMTTFQPNEVLLDIGANIGIYSIPAAGLFGARVEALEPYGPNVAALRRNVASNRLDERISVHRVAATDAERIGRLNHTGGTAGAAAQRFSGDTANDDGLHFEEVEGVPVDTLIERGRIAFPTRIKIDVDGNERAVIEGMTRTLADPRLHSVRLEVRWPEPAGRAVVARVQSFGFEARVDDDAKNLLFTRRKS